MCLPDVYSISAKIRGQGAFRHARASLPTQPTIDISTGFVVDVALGLETDSVA
jgi:hypothetical protein